MHHTEIVEPFRYPRKELHTVGSLEAFDESIATHKKIDFWKTIIKRHRVGIYLLFKKYQRRKYTLVM